MGLRIAEGIDRQALTAATGLSLSAARLGALEADGWITVTPERVALTPQGRLLADRIAALTQGDRGRAIVTYCHPDCWGSWNLGKRLVTLGYRKVHWFPQGIDGWQDGHDTAVSRPDPSWAARPKATAGQ